MIVGGSFLFNFFGASVLPDLLRYASGQIFILLLNLHSLNSVFIKDFHGHRSILAPCTLKRGGALLLLLLPGR